MSLGVSARRLAVTTALVSSILFCAYPGAATQLEAPASPGKIVVASSPLSTALAQVVASGEPLEAARRLGFRVYEDRIQVYVRCDLPAAAQRAATVFRQGGADSILQRDVRVQAWASPETIEVVASLPGVVRVERPLYVSKPPQPELGQAGDEAPSLRAGSRVTEGLTAMNGPAWQSAGTTGQGTAVGVIDSFSGYEGLLGTELPPATRVEFQKFGGGPRDTSPHGTACAEIIYDIAPGLEKMYLYEANTGLEVQEAIATLQARGVRVISASFGWPGYTPMDGTGFMQGTLAAFKNAGGLYVQAAGNYRNDTWWGTFVDADGDGWTEPMAGSADELNVLVLEGGSYANLPVGREIDVRLTWNQWSAPQTDLDLYLYYYDTDQAKWVIADKSIDVQSGLSSQYPEESITYTTAKAGQYGIAIARESGPTAVDMHLYVDSSYSNVFPQFRTAAASLTYPADDANVFSVAALNSMGSYALEPYSSAGPTAGPGGSIAGGRRKPDISGYANVATASYGTTYPFNGTSAATPHVAGAALLVWSVNPGWSASQVRSFLEGRAVDMGPIGADNDYGYGRLWLGPPVASSTAPVAGFSYSPANPVVNQSVSFTDASSGGPTSWLWSFGDGQTSTARNPSHTFTVAGVFSVTLTATNGAGSSSKTQNVSVSQVAAPVITYFAANPPAVVPGQQTILTWTSSGGTFASIDQASGPCRPPGTSPSTRPSACRTGSP